MRRAAQALAGAVALTGWVVAAPATADAPQEFTDSVTFVELNPCDPPNTHEITIVSQIEVHEHRNNTVIKIRSETSTDDGFRGFGSSTEVTRDGLAKGTYNYVQTHSENGQKFTVKRHYVVDVETGEFLVDTFRMRCVRR